MDRQRVILNECEAELTQIIERMKGASVRDRWYLGNRKATLEGRIRFLEQVLMKRKEQEVRG